MEFGIESTVIGADDEIKEVERLKFILDKANRFPGCLSDIEERRLMARLARLERKYNIRA